MPLSDKFGKVSVEKREQQYLDVAAVDVGIGQDAHFSVAKSLEIRVIVKLVRVYAQGNRYVVNDL